MRALSVRQPWAWAIIHAGKDIENRTRSTVHRGPLAIHASLGGTRREYEQAAAEIERIMGNRPPTFEDVPRGCIVGTVELTDCERESRSEWAHPGCVHWKLSRPRACLPFPMRGALFLFPVNERSLLCEAA